MDSFKKSFDGKTVHKDVSFDVKKGCVLGLLGGSGSGKSVILRALIGLEKPDEGSIQILGTDVLKLSEEELYPLREKVAYVFQDGALFDSMTVFENVAFPLREHSKLSRTQIKDRVSKILQDFGLAGSESLLKGELSGGMQKRVGLARAIVSDPEIILYDEPTAGLDPINTLKIQDLILKLKERDKTAILVTHDMPTAMAVCDDICLLHDGRIVARASVEELRANPKHPIYNFMTGKEEVSNA